jgi:hypothetical protein
VAGPFAPGGLSWMRCARVGHDGRVGTEGERAQAVESIYCGCSLAVSPPGRLVNGIICRRTRCFTPTSNLLQRKEVDNRL